MDIEDKIALATRSSVEEVITPADLRHLFETNSKPGHYIGYEVSGMLHIGSLIASGNVINDLNKAGVRTQVYMANMHSWINNKFGGDLNTINRAAEYYKEAFKFFCPGTKVVDAYELYKDKDFWPNVIKFAKNMTVARTNRALSIMGRKETDALDLAQYFYPPMQGVDIHTIGAQIAHAGMDQRRIHVLAREIYPSMGWKKPVAIHHHLLMGLQSGRMGEFKQMNKEDLENEMKMSKSKPDSAIFVHDSKDEIARKINKAHCPEKITENNPIIDYAVHLILPKTKSIKIERPKKFGGDIEIGSKQELLEIYGEGKLHPADLKNAVAVELDKMIKPVREHFEKPKNKKLLDVYKTAKITR